MLTRRKHGAAMLLKVSQVGRNVLRVVNCGDGSPRFGRDPKFAGPYFDWASLRERAEISNGGLHLIFTEDKLYRFEPPRTFSVCTAVTPAGAPEMVVTLNPQRLS